MTTRQLDWGSLTRTILLYLLFWIFVVIYFTWGFGLQTDQVRSFVNASFFLPGFFIVVYSLLDMLVIMYLCRIKFNISLEEVIVVNLRIVLKKQDEEMEMSYSG